VPIEVVILNEVPIEVVILNEVKDPCISSLLLPLLVLKSLSFALSLQFWTASKRRYSLDFIPKTKKLIARL
jgi:hypothetical protein